MNKPGIKIKVILFLGLGIGLTALLLIIFGKTTTLFRPSYEIKMRTSHVGELQSGNGVYLNGIKIGDVTNLELEPGLTHAIVTMKILGNYRIGKESRFVIHQQGFLGQYYVEVISTGESKEFYKDGDFVQSEDTIDFIQAGKLSVGLAMRVKETLKKLEISIGKTMQIFSSNTINQVDAIANNFGSGLEKGTSIVFNTLSLAESNTPIVDKFLSDIDIVKENWDSLRDKFFTLTNQITSVGRKNESHIETISSNFIAFKQGISKLKREKKPDRNASESDIIFDGSNFTRTVENVLRLTDKLNKLSSNINRSGIVGAFRKEDVKKAPEK